MEGAKMKKSVSFSGLAAWVLIAFCFVLGMLVGVVAFGDTPVQYVECGTCGAHVSEWWYTQGADGSPVEVCEYCYQLLND